MGLGKSAIEFLKAYLKLQNKNSILLFTSPSMRWLHHGYHPEWTSNRSVFVHLHYLGDGVKPNLQKKVDLTVQLTERDMETVVLLRSNR